MTQRQIEVDEVVTRTETVTYCDYCGESDDAEDKGDFVTFGVSNPPYSLAREDDIAVNDAKLHLHRECVKYGLGELGDRPTVQDVNEDSIRVLDSFDVWTIRLALFLAVTGAGFTTQVMLGTGGGFAVTVALLSWGVAAVCLHMSRYYGKEQADKALNKLGKDWR